MGGVRRRPPAHENREAESRLTARHHLSAAPVYRHATQHLGGRSLLFQSAQCLQILSALPAAKCLPPSLPLRQTAARPSLNPPN